jgi:hypothetical protein
MVDNDFCVHLEYVICNALKYSDDDRINGFWCDGVILDLPDNAYSHKFVNDNRQITLKAFVGKDGQEEYELTLKFGVKALSRFARNLDIMVCIPNPDEKNWFKIDTEQRKIELQLD